MLLSVHLHFFPTNALLSGDFSVYGSLTESDKVSLEGTFCTDCHVNVSLLLVRGNKCTSFLTNVVLGGDFSVYGSLTESEKLSLEGTFSTDCHVNVSLLPVRANKCTPSFLSDQCCPKW